MIYLLLAIAASTSILITFKIFEKYGIDNFTAITVNYIIGAIFGYNYIHFDLSVGSVLNASWFVMSALTGIVLIIGFVAFSLSAQKAGIAITAISSRMAVIISVLSGILLFNDTAHLPKIAGIALAIVAFYFTLSKENVDKPEFKVLLLPFMVFIFMGMNDLALKVTQFYFIEPGHDTAQTAYAATSFLWAFAIGTPVLIYRAFRLNQKIKLKSVLAGIFLGLINWYSIFYLLKGLEVMEISVFIPLLNISVVSLSAVTGYFIFHEKLSLKNWLGIITAIIAILLIAY
ncbi:MAG: EamA family transporter [Lentimicrobiaceae bacterium]|nr:EamA family transporter [Lentimicrobiaceae bacterium]MCO5265959.1 EamA family transporter [Lentimicrobium sp.]